MYSQCPVSVLVETVKVPELVAVPPCVVIVIFPLTAPVGTIAVTCVSGLVALTLNVAFTPPNVTLVVCLRLTPLMVTVAPTGPLVGMKLVICGITRNILLLFSVPLEVVTVTKPVVAPLGTGAIRKVPVSDVGFTTVPLKETVLVDVKPCPKNSIVPPTLPE